MAAGERRGACVRVIGFLVAIKALSRGISSRSARVMPKRDACFKLERDRKAFRRVCEEILEMNKLYITSGYINIKIEVE